MNTLAGCIQLGGAILQFGTALLGARIAWRAHKRRKATRATKKL